MIKWITFILNFPHTLGGILLIVLSIPYHIRIITNPFAVVCKVKSFWWGFWYLKNARALTIGHTILMSPKELDNDIQHEVIHVQQFEQYPFIFPFLYFYERAKKGYRMNRFEDEAYTKSKSFYNGVRQG